MWPFSRKAVTPVTERKFGAYVFGLGQARMLERRFDVLATEGYEVNPIAYACVSKAAQACASVDLQLYKKRGDDLQQIDKHDLLDLVVHPNAMMGGRKFVETLVTNYLLGGNSYILGYGAAKQTPPKELWVLPNQSVTPEAGDTMLLKQYKYQMANRQSIVIPVDQLSGACDLLHLKTVNPMNPLLGLPPLAAAAYGVDVFNSGQKWNKSLLDNGARPTGALRVATKDNMAAELSDEQYHRIKEQIETQYSGSVNAGKPLLLEGGLEWQDMGLSPRDMDHRENMLTNARFIAGVFHTPPQLVNIPGESTFANYAQAELSYWANMVLPLLGSLLEDINNWLPPLFGDDLFLWYDEEQIPALEPRRKEKFDRLNSCTFMSINEKRRAVGMDNYKPSDDPGDVVLVNGTQVPLELAGAMSLPEPGSEEDQDKPDKPADE